MNQIIKFTLVVLLGFVLGIGCDTKQKPSEKPSPTPKAGTSEVSPPITAAPMRVEDWPMFMNDLQFSGQSPDKRLKPPLQLQWQFKTGGPLEASPVIVNDILYIGSADGKFYALNAKKWEIKWVFNAQSPISTAAAVSGGYVYFSTRNNTVYALNAATGDFIWQFKTKTWIATAPIVSKGTVYVGAFPSRIYLLDAINGTLKSERKRTVRIEGVEYGCANAEFRPVFPEHNAEIWRGYTAGSQSYPIIANGFVYIGARDGNIHALNMASKEEMWSHQTGGFANAAPAISDGILYVSSGDGKVYAFANVTESAPPSTDTRPIGTFTHDDAPVYAEKAGTTPLFRLNDGMNVPILQTTTDWYQVELPNKRNVWIDKFSIGQFEETAGVLFNTNFCETPRTLQLITGAEYPQWSPDGQIVAMLVRHDLSGSYWQADELWIMDREGKRAQKLHSGQFYNPHISWSLDSRLLAYEVEVERQRYIYTRDWKLGRTRRLVKGEGAAWSPTANQLIFRWREKGFDIIYRINSDGSGGKTIARVPFKKPRRAYTHLPAPTWSTDGNNVAFGITQQRASAGTFPYAGIRVQNVAGQRVKEIPTQYQHVHQLRWSADGTQLAYVLSGSNKRDLFFDKRIHVVNIADKSAKTKIFKHTAPAWSPEGNLLAYLEREDCAGIRWKVWIYDMDSGKKFPIARTALELTALVWMPDGKHLCLWYTSAYLRDNAYKPAETIGWIVPISSAISGG